jgi:carboxyl-terminal processing protease
MRRIGTALIATLAFMACATGGTVLASGSAGDAAPVTPGVAAPEASIGGNGTTTRIQGTEIHGAIASAVGITLLTGHYSGRPINDALSREWLANYVDALDYSRIYFLQSDIDEITAWETKLDDDLLSEKPTLEAAWAIYDLYARRVDERVVRALEMLDDDLRFDDANAKVDIDRHDDPWATDAAALDLIWRDRIIEQLLRMELTEAPSTQTPVERLKRRYERVRKEARDVYPEDVLESYLGALSRAFDPHSSWFKPIAKENFDIDMRDTLTGIGAQLSGEDGYTVIDSLIPGGPAEGSQQLAPEDKILAVGQGTDGELVDIIDMRLDRVVQLIRGPANTTVHLVIHPASAADPSEVRDVFIVRDKVKLSHAAASSEVHELPGSSGTVKVGYIDVPSFYVDSDGQRAGDPNYGSTTRDVAKILGDMRAQGVSSLVIDLRNNGGGSLDEAIQLTGLFLPGGPVVQIRSREAAIEVLRDEDPSVAWDGPVVVLTSEISASASEIFAGALQDYGNGLIVGADSTHGKGTVQNLVGLERFLRKTGHSEEADQGGAVKFTTHMFFRVNGASTQVRGVRSDIVLPSPYRGMEIKEEHIEQGTPLPWDSVQPARYRRLGKGFDLPALTEASRLRVAADPEFGFLEQQVEERLGLDALDTLSLHIDTRRAETARLEALTKARDDARKAAGWDGEAEIDPIRTEALHIARDVVTLKAR